MLRRVVEDHPMARIAQERCPRWLGVQDASFAFLAQVESELRLGGHPAHQRLGLMRVEVIHHKMPPRGGWIGGDHALDVAQKIGFGAGRAAGGGQEVTAHHVATEDEGPRPMADILKLAPFHLAGRQRQIGGFALQRLDAGQFIRAHDAFALGRQRGGVPIHRTDISHFGVKLRLRGGRQPVPNQVRFERPLFNRRAAWRPEIWLTMPRRWISAAISRLVHWLMGRAEVLGDSHANAIIWHSCSAVIRRGAPDRGASVKRSVIGKSSRVAGCTTRQRSRQRRTRARGTANWRAIWQLFAPSAAANTIRARRASCWGVPWRRTRDSSPWRSVSKSAMAGGLGPRIGSSSVHHLAWFRVDVPLLYYIFI